MARATDTVAVLAPGERELECPKGWLALQGPGHSHFARLEQSGPGVWPRVIARWPWFRAQS